MSIGKPFKWSKRYYVLGKDIDIIERRGVLFIIAHPNGWMSNPDKPIDPDKTYYITIEDSKSVLKDGR